MDDGGIRGEGFRGKDEFQRSAGEQAMADFVADPRGPTVKTGRSERLIPVGHDHLEVFPEIGGAEGTLGRSAGTSTLLRREKPAVRLGEGDLYDDSHGFGLAAMVEKRLLRAEIALVVLGILHHLQKGSEEADFGDMRTGLRQRRKLRVFVVEGAQGFVVTLAEKVGLPDGGV